MSKNILIVESRYYDDIADLLLDAVIEEIKKMNLVTIKLRFLEL